MESHRPPLALTMGDPAGLGPELTIKAWQALRHKTQHPFFTISSLDLLRQTSREVPLAVIVHPSDAQTIFPDALPVLDLKLNLSDVTIGRPNPSCAPAILKSIEKSVAYAQNGSAAAIVTNPIHKSALQDQGFAFPGHTEYLAHLCGKPGADLTSVMMLAIPGLRVVPLTIHVAHNKVTDCLSTELIVRKAKIVAAALTRDFGLKAPKIGVAALNPHAGESGKFGDEEGTIIAPAIEALQQDGLHVEGPFPADTLFAEHMRRRFDTILCMYHDQALIPLKALNFHQGVNVTLGLPIVRTSPDHGTGFDIAGKMTASAESLIAAITLASEIADSRKADAEP